MLPEGVLSLFFPAIFGSGFYACVYVSQFPLSVLIATVFRHFETDEVLKKANHMALYIGTLGRNNCGNVNIWYYDLTSVHAK
jgi:hypothetical protein